MKLLYIVVYCIVLSYSYFIIILNNDKCKRNYPYVNLLLPVKEYCKFNPFKYYYNWNNSQKYLNLYQMINSNGLKNNYLFYTVVDDNSFKYLLNLYKVFLKPYSIYSLLTIVFYKTTLSKCRKYNIFCIYSEWPYFLKIAKELDLKKKLWFLKYYYFYKLIEKGISILFIDSDVLFINNCLFDLVKRKEDVVLLKSQLPQKNTFGNSGITYMLID